MFLQVLLCLVIHTLMDQLQLLGDCCFQLLQLYNGLLTVVPAHQHALAILQIPGAALYAHGHTFHLVLRTLPAHGIVGIIHICPEAGSDQPVLQLVGRFQNAGLMLGNRQNHHLNRCNLGRQYQTVIVAVGHNDAADQTGGHAPRGLMGVDLLIVFVCKGNVKGLCKAISKVMGCTCLQSLAVVHHTLDGVGCFCAVELFLVCLLSPGHRHSQNILTEVRIDAQHPLGLFPGFLCSGVHGMTLLPQKFPMAQEGAAGLFPAQHTAPLIEHHRQIPVGLDCILEILTEQGFGSRTDAVTLFQPLTAAISDPRALRREALYVVLFLLKQAFGDQHRHIDILRAGLLKLGIHDALDVLPDRIAIRTVNKHTLNGRIIDQLGLFAHIGKPLRKIHFHIRDLSNLFFLCHISFILSNGYSLFIL